MGESTAIDSLTTSANSIGTDTSHSSSWPGPLQPEALHGLPGEIVETLAPHTEADPAALLVQELVAFGNVVGRKPHFRAEADRHGLNLYTAVVGKTSKARKGTSWGHIKWLHTEAENHLSASLKPSDTGLLTWPARLASGLVSGEGLIYHLRDAQPSVDKKSKDDPGVTDKRLLVIETEFASVLNALSRDGNTLSAVLRNAWDGQEILQTLTKNSPTQATGAHVSIIAHITIEELRLCLDETEAANGFGNRFLWTCAKRSQCLPHGGKVPNAALGKLVNRLREAVDFGRYADEITRDDAANELWSQVYPELSEGKPGLFGAITARAEAQTMRLACVFALLDLSYVVNAKHLNAALAVWKYCEHSAWCIFGGATGDPIADKILKALSHAPGGLLQSEIIKQVLQGNQKVSKVVHALELLVQYGLVWRESVKGPTGPPGTRWYASNVTKQTKQTT